jgi:hypothetical protein
MPLPAWAIAAIIGGGSMLGGLLGGGDYEYPQQTTPPDVNRLRQFLTNFYMDQGPWRPPYEGELSAPWEDNPALMAALMGVGGMAGQYDSTIQQLIAQFSAPGGSRGWMPSLPSRGGSVSQHPPNPLGPYTGWGGGRSQASA